MTLEEYKIKNNLSYYVLGQQLGCESINPAVMAQRYCQAKRFPRPKMIIKIEKLTNNQVTMRDILDEYIKKIIKFPYAHVKIIWEDIQQTNEAWIDQEDIFKKRM